LHTPEQHEAGGWGDDLFGPEMASESQPPTIWRSTFGLVRASLVGGSLLLVAAIAFAACSGGNEGDGDSAPAKTPAADAPSVCDDLVADDALGHLGEQLRSVTIENGDSEALIGSAEALRNFESTFPSATRAAATLEALAEAPGDAEKTEALVDAFTALDAEVQAACAFPLS
jgi:hypothetical protein